jgi:hypothetical protein
MVTDVWYHDEHAVAPTTTVRELKRDALTRALRRAEISLERYIVKFRGAPVLDESLSLGDLGAGPNSPFIVLPVLKQPVR